MKAVNWNGDTNQDLWVKWLSVLSVCIYFIMPDLGSKTDSRFSWAGVLPFFCCLNQFFKGVWTLRFKFFYDW